MNVIIVTAIMYFSDQAGTNKKNIFCDLLSLFLSKLCLFFYPDPDNTAPEGRKG